MSLVHGDTHAAHSGWLTTPRLCDWLRESGPPIGGVNTTQPHEKDEEITGASYFDASCNLQAAGRSSLPHFRNATFSSTARTHTHTYAQKTEAEGRGADVIKNCLSEKKENGRVGHKSSQQSGSLEVDGHTRFKQYLLRGAKTEKPQLNVSAQSCHGSLEFCLQRARTTGTGVQTHAAK